MIPSVSPLELALVALSTMALGLNLFNALVWPRGHATKNLPQKFPPKISVLIPARNEERGIERAVRSVFKAGTPIHELIVYDDGSTDQTPQILTALQAEFPKLRVEKGIGLPPGWVGKPHACHRLAGFAQGELLVFLDADVEVLPGGLDRLLGLFAEKKAELVTAVPRQITKTFTERLVLPLLHLTYASWLPTPLVWLTHDPRFLAANGQVLAVRRETYDAIGGFEAVRTEVVDDMAFCRLAKKARRRVVFADGHHIAQCRMYTSARGVWEGFSKNLYEGVGAHPVGLLGVIFLYTMTFILPYILLAISPIWPALFAPALAGLLANLAIRILLTIRHHHPPEGILLHPVAVVVLLAIAVNSWRWHQKGAIVWSGRTYAAKANR